MSSSLFGKGMNVKKWLIGWGMISGCSLIILAAAVFLVDPYFHYRKPDTEKYRYELNNQRSQNDGITRYFDYDAIITGTSMTENFKASEMDALFDCHSVKIPFAGGTFSEINSALTRAISYNSGIKYIVRGLDMWMLLDDKDRMRYDMGEYPTYLYDSNPFNDVQYLLNRDVFWQYVFPMVCDARQGKVTAGITSFDDYSAWNFLPTFGKNIVRGDEADQKTDRPEQPALSPHMKDLLYQNITQNVTALADANPGITFYLFFTPYSAAWWEDQIKNGFFYRQTETEKMAIELLLEHENIKLFSFNNRTDITTDLNNYKDTVHFGPWVNSLIMKWMHDGRYELTRDNYKEYLKEEQEFYESFDYSLLDRQEDYACDALAAVKWQEELTGTKPFSVTDWNQTEEGAEYLLESAEKYRYLVYEGKTADAGRRPAVLVVSEDKETVSKELTWYAEMDDDWHRYVLDLSKAKGTVRIILKSRDADLSVEDEPVFEYRNITLH